MNKSSRSNSAKWWPEQIESITGDRIESQSDLVRWMVQAPAMNVKILADLEAINRPLNDPLIPHSSCPPLLLLVRGRIESPEVLMALIHLIQAGADVNARNERGDTALHLVMEQAWWTSMEGNDPIIIRSMMQALLDAGADPTIRNRAGTTPWLMRLWSDVALIKALQKAGANPLDVDRADGGTLWHRVDIRQSDHIAMAMALPNNVPIRANHMGLWPWQRWVMQGGPCTPEAVALIRRLAPTPKVLNRAVRPPAQAGSSLFQKSGETVLHLARLAHDVAWVDALLELGADPHARDDEGRTVLGVWVQNDVSVWDLEDWSTLSTLRESHQKGVQRLLLAGASPNDISDRIGRTAWQIFFDQAVHLDTVELIPDDGVSMALQLIEHGADLDARWPCDKSGMKRSTWEKWDALGDKISRAHDKISRFQKESWQRLARVFLEAVARRTQPEPSVSEARPRPRL